MKKESILWAILFVLLTYGVFIGLPLLWLFVGYV